VGDGGDSKEFNDFHLILPRWDGDHDIGDGASGEVELASGGLGTADKGGAAVRVAEPSVQEARMDLPGVSMDPNEIGSEKPTRLPFGRKVAAAEVCGSGFGGEEDILRMKSVFIFRTGQEFGRLSHGWIGQQFIIAPERRRHEDGLPSIHIQ
jgi:hypothetical protein